MISTYGYLADAARMIALPAPGRYVLAPRWRDLPALYVDVLGPAACGGPYLDVVHRSSAMHVRDPGVRRTVRIAVDGSWRDPATLLPLNAHGQIVGGSNV